MFERMTRQEIETFRKHGWRTYNSEAVNYDYLLVGEIDGRTVTRRVKLLRLPDPTALTALAHQ